MSQKKAKKKSIVDELKIEWSLFWEGFMGEDLKVEAQTSEALAMSKLQSLSLVQVKAMTKALSADRKKINQQLEDLSKQTEEALTRIEALRLVGGDLSETETKLTELTDLGHNLSAQLQKIDDRLRWTRLREDEMKKSLREL